LGILFDVDVGLEGRWIGRRSLYLGLLGVYYQLSSQPSACKVYINDSDALGPREGRVAYKARDCLQFAQATSQNRTSVLVEANTWVRFKTLQTCQWSLMDISATLNAFEGLHEDMHHLVATRCDQTRAIRSVVF
jgi:hypothetical protein